MGTALAATSADGQVGRPPGQSDLIEKRLDLRANPTLRIRPAHRFGVAVTGQVNDLPVREAGARCLGHRRHEAVDARRALRSAGDEQGRPILREPEPASAISRIAGRQGAAADRQAHHALGESGHRRQLDRRPYPRAATGQPAVGPARRVIEIKQRDVHAQGTSGQDGGGGDEPSQRHHAFHASPADQPTADAPAAMKGPQEAKGPQWMGRWRPGGNRRVFSARVGEHPTVNRPRRADEEHLRVRGALLQSFGDGQAGADVPARTAPGEEERRRHGCHCGGRCAHRRDDTRR